jgi:DHA1 family inner membrane transport protein
MIASSIETTARSRVGTWLLIGSGVIAAAQIGKAIISVPMIRAEMGLGLDLAGAIVATFATLGACAGIGAGVVVQRIGLRLSLIAGMSAITIGNLIGAAAPSELALLLARVIEGVGFFGVVLAIPSVLARIIEEKNRNFVMAAWSAYMPAGIMLMLLVGPFMDGFGWRNLWFANAAASGACALILARCAPRVREGRETPERFFAEAVRVARNPFCLMLGFAFFAYSCQIFSLAFALPQLLTSAYGTTLGAAGLLSAAVLAVSAMGHVSSGFLLRAGVPIWASIAVAFTFFAIASFAIYAGALPPAGVALVAALALGVGGLAPGALYASVPRAAPSPHAVPATIGLLQQASNLGQFAGPIALGTWVAHSGWHAAPIIVAPAALIGLGAALVMRGATGRSRTRPSPAREALPT